MHDKTALADKNESVHVKIKKLCLLSSALYCLTACSHGQAFSPPTKVDVPNLESFLFAPVSSKMIHAISVR